MVRSIFYIGETLVKTLRNWTKFTLGVSKKRFDARFWSKLRIRSRIFFSIRIDLAHEITTDRLCNQEILYTRFVVLLAYLHV